MSKAMLLGVREMQGEFQGKPYHTIALHIAEKFDSDKSYGSEVSVQKVKYERLPFILSSPVESVKDFAERFIGSQLDLSYDKNGKITFISTFADGETDKKK
ncbi:MAG: hypothetical protein NC253_01520 [Ruminococcus sp.]|nr:hypothetical protein [Ruminococcus sp.]MCM1381156.1 hypothetical protein [Muribaculaceae bacterium]MCM1479647.1 hypothetical protein [Muribaculaceae bacterium]